MQALVRDIKNQISPQTLNLSNNWPEAMLNVVIEALYDNFSTTNLILSSNKLWGPFGEKIYHLLTRNSHIQKIDLSKNELGDEGIKYIANALKINISLKELKLCNNEITDTGGYLILKALDCNSSLTSLQLSWNSISDHLLESINATIDGSTSGKKSAGLAANRINYYETQISSYRAKLSETTKQLRKEEETNKKLKTANAKVNKELRGQLDEYRLQTVDYLDRIDNLNRQLSALQQREVPLPPSSTGKEGSEGSGSELCKVCEENPIEMVIIPCGHYILCHTCIDQVQTCPYCRCTIVQKLKVFK